MIAGINHFPHLPKRISGLGELAENLWWSWRPRARMLFKMLDRQAWKESGHNPDKMLKEFSAEMLSSAAQNPEYLRHYDVVMSIFQAYMKRKDLSPDLEPLEPGEVAVAYFSAEYGLHRSLPFYAGGLGFLSGDFIKECSDQNIPLVAVGINTLYLMDTDIEQNALWNRSISARLYSGDMEQRLRQEIVLGIGGAELLEKLAIRYRLLHLNEGHAAFSLLERMRDGIRQGLTFEAAFNRVKQTTAFTT